MNINYHFDVAAVEFTIDLKDEVHTLTEMDNLSSTVIANVMSYSYCYLLSLVGYLHRLTEKGSITKMLVRWSCNKWQNPRTFICVRWNAWLGKI